MIAHLSGTLLAKQATTVILDVGGVGYEVTIPLSTFYDLEEAGADVCSTHLHACPRRRAATFRLQDGARARAFPAAHLGQRHRPKARHHDAFGHERRRDHRLDSHQQSGAPDLDSGRRAQDRRAARHRAARQDRRALLARARRRVRREDRSGRAAAPQTPSATTRSRRLSISTTRKRPPRKPSPRRLHEGGDISVEAILRRACAALLKDKRRLKDVRVRCSLKRC